MTWTVLPFGKYTGRTLPQVLFTDPGWFFWAHTKPLHGAVAYDAGVLYPKATRIRVPRTENLLVEYVLPRIPRPQPVVGVGSDCRFGSSGMTCIPQVTPLGL